MDEDERIARLMTGVSTALNMTASLCVKTGLFGKPKPTESQIGWAAGFCDSATRQLNLSDADAFAFLTVAFEQAFGKNGAKIASEFLHDQDRYFDHMFAGGQAYVDWVNEGKSPMMPFAN